jgi:hypothetical protein
MGTLSIVTTTGKDQVLYAAPDTKGLFTFTYRVCNTYGLCSTASVGVTLA